MTLSVVLVIALAAGAIIGVFSVAQSVLIKPLPYPEADRLVYVNVQLARGGAGPFVAAKDFLRWEEQARTLETVSAFMDRRAALQDAQNAASVTCGEARASFFQMLGVRPAYGRLFTRVDSDQRAGNVVVLSYKLWLRQFAGRPDIVGRQIKMDGKSFTVIGVLPADFTLVDRFAIQYDLWVPLRIEPGPSNIQLVRVIGRLRTGQSASSAREELDSILRANSKGTNQKHALVVGWARAAGEGARQPLVMFLCAAGLVFIMAIVNVAAMLGAKTLRARRDDAIRISLGASRVDLFGEYLASGLMLAFMGGLAGFLTSGIYSHLIDGYISNILPARMPAHLNLWTVCFAISVTAFVGTCIGCIPIAILRTIDPKAIQAGANFHLPRWANGIRPSSVIVISEIALATAVIISSGFLFQSMLRTSKTNLGFRDDHLLTMSVELLPSAYSSDVSVLEYARRLQRVASETPGVVNAALSTALPLSGNTAVVSGLVSKSGNGKLDGCRYEVVSSNYFQVMGLPIEQGRGFTEGNGQGDPEVIVVNQAFVRKYFADVNPLGELIGPWGDKGKWLPIAGIVGNVRESLFAEPRPAIYASYEKNIDSRLTLIARTDMDPIGPSAGIRARMAESDDRQPFEGISSMEDLRAKEMTPLRVSTGLVAVFACIALGLSAVGVFGISLYSMVARRRDVGIRIALGANHLQAMTSILRSIVLCVVFGEFAGILLTLCFRKAVQTAFQHVTGAGMGVYLLASGLLGIVSVTAYAIPAWGAMRMKPSDVLRTE
jgi:putative ABC transport system permease protein